MLGVAAMVQALMIAGLDPTRHAWDATCWVLVLWIGVHVGIGALMAFYCVAGIGFGKLTPRWDADLGNVALYWHFLALSSAITLALLGLFPVLGIAT